jgi:hypothetical protein
MTSNHGATAPRVRVRVVPPAGVALQITNGWDYQDQYSATIFEDGTVRYVRKTSEGTVASTKRLSKPQLAQLGSAFEKANYSALSNVYGGQGNPGDVGPLPESITTSYTRRGRTKTVAHDRGTYVPALSEMEVRMEEILGTETWIKAPR